MWQVFLITFREGLESLLIMVVLLGVLKKQENRHLLSAVYTALISSVLLSFGISYFLSSYMSYSSAWEGIMACIGGLVVLGMVLLMQFSSNNNNIIERLNLFIGQTSWKAWWGVFFFSLFLTTREGIEIAFLISILFKQTGWSDFLAGAFLGIFLAVILITLVTYYSSQIQLSLFLKGSAFFLILFSFQLFWYGFHELVEANLIPILDNEYWHALTEEYGPEGPYALWYTLAILVFPLVWKSWHTLKKTFCKSYL